MAYPFIGISVAVLGLIAIAAVFWPPAAWLLLLAVPLVGLGLADLLQTRHAVLRNFPLLGKGRYLLEMIRPEINQYFIESEQDGRPLNREQRSIVYQRSKRALQTLPFGTQLDVGAVGYEWINHSILARHAAEPPRITVGEGRCRQRRCGRSTAARPSAASRTTPARAASASTIARGATSSGRSAPATSAAGRPMDDSIRTASRPRRRPTRSA
jgi:glutamate synthase domain-containing protein 2